MSKKPQDCFEQSSRILALAGVIAMLLGAQQSHAGTFSTSFISDPGGTALGIAEIEDGVLKLTDLADLPPAEPAKPLPQNGSYVLPDFDGGQPVQSFTANFKAAVGGGSSLGAQGFSFVLANDLPTDPSATFREGGGTSQGLVISFDTIDNLAGFNAEGNEPGDAPGIIVKLGGVRVAARPFRGIQTYPANSPATRFANVEVKVDPDGTLDVTYDGVKVYDNVAIGYTPIAGVFGFGAGTAELTAAIRNNHWIDDVNITTATAGAGAYVCAKSPGASQVRADATVSVVLQNLTFPVAQMSFNGAVVVPTITSSGNTRTFTYDPPGLLPAGSTNRVELTYDTNKKFVFDFTVANYPTIAATAKAKGTINTASDGFKTRVYQTTGATVASLAAAERQLAGLAGANVANLSGADPDGTFTLTTINFDDDQVGAGQFPIDNPIPGYPGTGPDQTEALDNIVVESIAYLDLPAGLVTLGVTSDDGFKVSVGGDPRDVTSQVVGQFEGVSTSTFSFAVAEAGIYPIRFLWYEGVGDAHAELYSFNAAGERVLLNDRSTAGHIIAYSERSGTIPPYVSSAKPFPSETGVDPKLSFEAKITEESTTVVPSSIQVRIAGISIPVSISKSGKVTTLTYNHGGQVAQGTYPVLLTFTDSAGNTVERTWSFVTSAGSCESAAGPQVTGYWTFDDGTLKASVGLDMAFIDPAISSFYSFGTTGQGAFADVPNINGKPAKILAIPRNENGTDFKRTGLKVSPGLAPSGGGQNANVWTMIMDVYWGDGHGNGTVLRTHDLNLDNDGDLFWAATQGSYGKGCCSSYDGIDPAHNQPRHTWARVVIVADMTSTPKRLAKYINGFKHREDVTGDGANIDGRFSLPSLIYMFNDGDDNEQSTAYVSAVQFREGALTDQEVAALNGPSADGIPVPGGTQSSGVASQWDFNGNLNAAVGTSATFIDPAISSHYSFGTTGQGAFSDIPHIDGEPAQFLAIPRNENGTDFKRTGLRINPGIPANGGGNNANVWTLIMDLYWGEGHGNGTVLRTHDLNLDNDGDLFWAATQGSYGKGCCSSYDGIDPANNHPRHSWRRVVIVADMSSTPKRLAKYVNGVKHREDVTGDGANIDGRFSLPSEIFMFNDGDDNEQSTVFMNAIQYRPLAMTDAEVLALGGPSAAGIPQPQTVSPRIKGHWDFEGNLAATVGTDAAYIDNALSSFYVIGTTGEGALADVPGINGQPTGVLMIPRNENGTDFKRTGLRIDPGIPANGGGNNANVWTMIMDVYWGDGHGNGTVLRTHDLNLDNDGDLFWAAGQGSYGKGCCSSYDGIDPAHNQPRHTWRRAVFVADMSGTPKRLAKYINGVKHREDVTGDGANIDGRFSLPSLIYMFNDGDDNEQSTVVVNAVQFREGAMTDEEVAALGGPTIDGPPLTAASGVQCLPLGGGVVEVFASSTVNGTYAREAAAVVNTTTRTITVPVPNGTRFYRLRAPTALTITSAEIENTSLILSY